MWYAGHDSCSFSLDNTRPSASGLPLKNCNYLCIAYHTLYVLLFSVAWIAFFSSGLFCFYTCRLITFIFIVVIANVLHFIVKHMLCLVTLVTGVIKTVSRAVLWFKECLRLKCIVSSKYQIIRVVFTEGRIFLLRLFHYTFCEWKKLLDTVAVCFCSINWAEKYKLCGWKKVFLYCLFFAKITLQLFFIDV